MPVLLIDYVLAFSSFGSLGSSYVRRWCPIVLMGHLPNLESEAAPVRLRQGGLKFVWWRTQCVKDHCRRLASCGLLLSVFNFII